MMKSDSKHSEIARNAARLYVDKPEFTMKELASKSGISVSDLYQLFPNRNSILVYYYTAKIYEADEIIQNIEGYQEYTLAEKLSILAYTLTDLLQEDREYVEQTFQELICTGYQKTDFEKQVEQRLKHTISNDHRISSTASFFMNPFVYTIIQKHYIWMIQYWLNDGSAGFEDTMALIDKWTALLQELLYNSLIDKSLDLTKFLFVQSGINEWFHSDQKKKKSSVQNDL
jgi:AcrR family transcriptional regulator